MAYPFLAVWSELGGGACTELQFIGTRQGTCFIQDSSGSRGHRMETPSAPMAAQRPERVFPSVYVAGAWMNTLSA